MLLERPIIISDNGSMAVLPTTSPLTVSTPENDDDAITLELLQQLIQDKKQEIIDNE
jgi:hypothetical protein